MHSEETFSTTKGFLQHRKLQVLTIIIQLRLNLLTLYQECCR